MEKCFLTNGGNLLRFHPDLKKYYFCKANGEFIREVSFEEGDYLNSICQEVILTHPLAHPKTLPVWHFIGSYCIEKDYSNYKAETSSNGGNYAFFEYEDWYMSHYPNGEIKFAYVLRHTSSAEFLYTELGGHFDSNPGTCYLLNVQGEVSYTMGCRSHDEVLEKIATMSSFDHLWNSSLHFIPSEKGDECVYSALSFTDKKEIVSKLKHLFESQDSLEEYTWEEFRKANATARRKKSRGGGKKNVRR